MQFQDLQAIINECQDREANVFPAPDQARQLRAHPGAAPDFQRQIYNEPTFAAWIMNVAHIDQDYGLNALAGPELVRSPAGREMLMMMVAAFDELAHTQAQIPLLPVAIQARAQQLFDDVVNDPANQIGKLRAWIGTLHADALLQTRQDITDFRAPGVGATLPVLAAAPAGAPNFPLEEVEVDSMVWLTDRHVGNAPGDMLAQVQAIVELQLEKEAAQAALNAATASAQAAQRAADQAEIHRKFVADANAVIRNAASAASLVTAADAARDAQDAADDAELRRVDAENEHTLAAAAPDALTANGHRVQVENFAADAENNRQYAEAFAKDAAAEAGVARVELARIEAAKASQLTPQTLAHPTPSAAVLTAFQAQPAPVRQQLAASTRRTMGW